MDSCCTTQDSRAEICGTFSAKCGDCQKLCFSLRTLFCTALSSLTFEIFALFMAHCHTGQSLNQPSPCRTPMEPVHTTEEWKHNIASNFCKNTFAKYPLFSAIQLWVRCSRPEIIPNFLSNQVYTVLNYISKKLTHKPLLMQNLHTSAVLKSEK